MRNVLITGVNASISFFISSSLLCSRSGQRPVVTRL